MTNLPKNFDKSEFKNHLNDLKTDNISDNVYTALQISKMEFDESYFLWNPFIPPVGLGMLYGPSDTGKSSFLRELILRLVLGKDEYLGYPLMTKHKEGIYLTTEDGVQAIHYILNKMPYDLTDNLRFIFNVDNPLQTLDEQLTLRPADLVICDAFGDLFTGKDMNSSSLVRQFLNDYSKLAEKHKTFILFMHHSGKRTEDSAPNKNNAVGSQSIEAKVRIAFELRQGEGDVRHLCVTKGNYLSKEHKQRSIDLLFKEDSLTFENTNQSTEFDNLKKGTEPQKKEIDCIWSRFRIKIESNLF